MNALARMLGVTVLLILAGSCSTGKKSHKTEEIDFPWWCLSHGVEPASEEDVALATASEIKQDNMVLSLGGGIELAMRRGKTIGDNHSCSTSSYYSLKQAGKTVATFPSRFSTDGFDGAFRVWASADRSIILVYEWIGTGVDVHEQHLVFSKEGENWAVQGLELPTIKIPASDNSNNRPGFIGPYGPHVLGLSGNTIIILPCKGFPARAKIQNLERAFPFPFVVG